MRHKDLVGAEAIHQVSYYQSADPGAVGAGKEWWDTTASPPTLKRRDGANAAWTTVVTGAPASSKFVIPVFLGNGVDAITTSEPEFVIWLDMGNFDITGWTLSGDATGSIVLKVERSPFAAFPTLTDIMASERPTLASARAAEDTLAQAVSFTTKVALRVTVVSATTVKAVTVSFSCTRV